MPLPLPDRVPVAAALVFLLPLPLSDRVPVALGGKDVMVTRMLIESVSTLLLMIQDCCWSAFRCCVVRVSRLPLPPLSDRVSVVAVVFLLYLEGGRHGGHDLDRGRVDVVDDAKGRVVCISRLPLPLSDRVPVAAVVDCHCHCRNAFRLMLKDVMVTKMLMENMLMLLMMLMDCFEERNKQTR